MELTRTSVRKIAVFRALQLGDLLCAVPAVRTLRDHFPNSEITLIGLPWASAFTQQFNHLYNRFIEFPGYPGLPERKFDTGHFLEFVREMNNERFDLLIQMHGNGSVINPMIAMLGARQTAGYRERGRYCPDENKFMVYPDSIHEIHRHLSLMEFLGFEAGPDDLEFPVVAENVNNCHQLLSENNLDHFICLHPGARDQKRWWSIKHFADVGNSLSKKGYKIAVTGTLSEKEVTAQLICSLTCPAVDLTGKTDLGTLACIIGKSSMLVSNDTGVSHIAAAVRTPSIVICLTSDPRRWSPLNEKIHKTVLPHEAADASVAMRYADELHFMHTSKTIGG